MSRGSSNEYDVVVVGLGPTGLTLAHLLGRRGLRTLVLEREPEFYGNARAVYTDDEALRVFQTAGVADDIHEDMNVDSTVQWVREDGSVLVQFRTPDRPLWWPVTNFLYQPYMETKLEALLERYPHVEVRRGHEVLDFAQGSDGVSITHAPSTGSGYGKRENAVDISASQTVRAAYLIGADGGRSVVRTKLGIDMTGKTYSERWLVVDLAAKEAPDGGHSDAFRHLPYFDFICNPDMPTVSCPQPGGHHRFEFELKDGDVKEEFESDQTVHRLIGQYVDVDEVEVRRKLVYTFNACTADRWRSGRVLLAGDAAHMTPQFVGQGMNAGVRDADNLSWKLEAILRHGADPAILDTYETERKSHATAMIALSVFNKSLVSVKNPVKARARDLALTTAIHAPGLGSWVRRAGMKPKPRFKKETYLGLPRGPRGIEGTLPPQPVVRRYDGRPIRLDDALGIGWALLGVGVDPRDGDDLAIWDQVAASYATLYGPGTRPQGTIGDGRRRTGLIDIEDTTGELTRWLRHHGIRPGSVVALRPDKYVFGVAPVGDPTLGRALASQLGVARSIRPAVSADREWVG
ncbi:bifunctional 3-(3-hydroxy-phenyl)propionate/3-hydroxycinnamic acid hydroxylase [Nocardioides sp. NPDC087217]|uniref:bifunctional 3-(3-hydroxy-phenyl)propionate/3-hydroxycinnamic acid hydroxylase MhpA n=1 Tax=Nocardioides sp. NPDC087217 TaxID=3364335 RepID=UPI0037F3C91D